jgi:hypothetical protein
METYPTAAGTLELAADPAARRQATTPAVNLAETLLGAAGPNSQSPADANPRRVLLFHGSAVEDGPVSVTVFGTEAEAREVFAVLRGSASCQSDWVEVASVGGESRPAVVAWFGRPFPPISQNELGAWSDVGGAFQANG